MWLSSIKTSAAYLWRGFAAVCKPLLDSALVFYAAEAAIKTFFPAAAPATELGLAITSAVCSFFVVTATYGISIWYGSKKPLIGNKWVLSAAISFASIRLVAGWFAVNNLFGGDVVAQIFEIIPALVVVTGFFSYDWLRAQKHFKIFSDLRADKIDLIRKPSRKIVILSVLGSVATSTYTFLILEGAGAVILGKDRQSVITMFAGIGALLELPMTMLRMTGAVYKELVIVPDEEQDELTPARLDVSYRAITRCFLTYEMASSALGYIKASTNVVHSLFGVPERNLWTIVLTSPIWLGGLMNYFNYYIVDADRRLTGHFVVETEETGELTLLNPPNSSAPSYV